MLFVEIFKVAVVAAAAVVALVFSAILTENITDSVFTLLDKRETDGYLLSLKYIGLSFT